MPTFRRNKRFVLQSVFSFLVAGLVVGCSLLVDTDAVQCSTDTDCAKFNRNALFKCQAGGCVAQTADAGPTGKITCSSNQECQTVSADSVGICDQATKSCIPLKSQDCGEVIGTVNDDSTVIFGAILPKTQTHEQMGRGIQAALTLAAGNEFSANKSRLPRPVAVVVCDDAADPVRAANHLVKNVKVPAIIAGGLPANARLVAEKVTKAADVLLVSSTATTAFGGADLGIWRTVPSDEKQVAAAMASAALFVEKRVKADPPNPTSVKWAIIRKADDYGNGLRTELLGFSPFSTASRDLNYGNPDSNDPPKNFTGVVSDIGQGSPPNAIALLGNAEAATQVIDQIEASGLRPYYLVSNGLMTKDLLTIAAKYVDGVKLRDRILGVVPGENQANPTYATFQTKYAASFKPETNPPPSRSFGITQTYDAFYALTYATVSLGATTAVSGTALRGALVKLTSGTKASVDGSKIVEVVAAVKGGPVDLDGTSGGLDFNATTGVVSSPIQLWCINASTDFELAGRFQAAGSSDVKLQSASANLGCPAWSPP